MSDQKKLPWVCPDHPKGKIRHTWDTDYFRNGNKLGQPIDRNHRFFCAECNRELAVDERVVNQ